MKKLTAIDLFSGAGGLTLGLHKAGFDTLFAVEFNPKFASTYEYNFPQTKLIIDDISNLTKEDILSYTKDYEVDIIVGGPPCQGFSMAGNIGRQFLDDDRNKLFKEYVRIVEIVKPKVFLMENVAALARHNKGKSLKEIINSFEKLDYDIVYKVVNASEYDVPQERRRIIIVGTHKVKNNFTFKTSNNSKKTVFEAINDLPPLENGGTSNIPNHNAMKHTKPMLEKMSYITDGGNRMEIPEELRPKSGDARKYIKYDSTKPSVTVTGDMRKIFHYNQNRALTARELARLQSFPDSFVFIGNSIDIQQQIGNAVPPKLAFKLFKDIKELLLDDKISNS